MLSGRDSPNMDDASCHSLSRNLRKSLRMSLSLHDEISVSDETSISNNEDSTNNQKGSDQGQVDTNIADLQRELARLKALRIVAKEHEQGQEKAISTLREERDELQRAIDHTQKNLEEKEENILHTRVRARHLMLMVKKMEEEKEEIAEILKRTREEKEQLKKTLGVLDSPEVSSLIRKRCHSRDSYTSIASLPSEKASSQESKQPETTVDSRRSKWVESQRRETRRSGSLSSLSEVISRSSRYLVGVEKELLDLDDCTTDDDTNSFCASECIWTSSESMATSNRSLNAARRSSMGRRSSMERRSSMGRGSKRMLLASKSSSKKLLSSTLELEVAHEDIPAASASRRGGSIKNMLLGLKQEAQ